MKTNEIRDRIRVIKQKMDRARCAVVSNFYTDKNEVAIWKAVHDELLLERNLLEAELAELEKSATKLSDEFEAASFDWALRFASHPDRDC